MEGQLYLTTKFRLLCHKLNINGIKARIWYVLSCLIKTEKGTKLNITFHWVNFDQKLNCQSRELYSNGIKTRTLKHWPDWKQKKKTFESSWCNKVQWDFWLLQWCETSTYCIWNYCIKFIICDKKSSITGTYSSYWWFKALKKWSSVVSLLGDHGEES